MKRFELMSDYALTTVIVTYFQKMTDPKKQSLLGSSSLVTSDTANALIYQ